MGRPHGLTEERIAEICALIKACNREVSAAAKLGIAERTFYRWKKRGKVELAQGKDTIFTKLVQALGEAAAGAEVRMVAIIALAAQEKWQAAAWWLERRFPDHYGLRPRSENTEKNREAKSAVAQLLAHLTGEIEKEPGEDGPTPPEPEAGKVDS